MTKKRIKISPSWATSEEVTNRIISQFKTPETNLDNIEFVYDQSYDIIVYFNHITEEPLNNKKGYIFPNEPYWAGSHQKDISQYPNITIFGFDCRNYLGNCIESKMQMVYGGQGPPYDKIDFWNYNNLINLDTKKNKNISCTITQKRGDFAPTCLYDKRYHLVDSIKNQLSFIDLYGGWRNFTDKKDALLNYRFCLTIENEYSKNLITEKFYDCVLTNTIPIYYGCSNIKEIHPQRGYILIENIDDIESIKEQLIQINNNAQEIYNSIIPQLFEIKKHLFTKYNLLKKIIEL